MQNKPEVNADSNAVISLQTRDMPWVPTGFVGVEEKVLERINDPRKGRETLLLKLSAGASLPKETLTQRLDIFSLEGSYTDGIEEYGKHTFVRNSPGADIALFSEKGCTLYVKRREPIRSTDNERFVVDSSTAQWMDFPHRGATVLHLYRDPHGIETSRFGRVHPERKIPSHDHAMGEETLVIDGILKDEYTIYEPGAWFRMPIGVAHAPYTEGEGCLMLIREGDLVW
ncbi:MAG: cupin domain-containing protein [Burkholderiaceae bacterium]|nr:cupin domain-containing protein [Burkholderiaceae bacterium]